MRTDSEATFCQCCGGGDATEGQRFCGRCLRQLSHVGARQGLSEDEAWEKLFGRTTRRRGGAAA